MLLQSKNCEVYAFLVSHSRIKEPPFPEVWRFSDKESWFDANAKTGNSRGSFNAKIFDIHKN